MPLFGPRKPNVEKLAAKKNVEELIKVLTGNADPQVRSAAAIALGKIGDIRAGQPLIAALIDVNDAVRKSAITALRQFRGASVSELLIAALKHVNKEVRAAAAIILGETKDTRAVEPLIASLADTDFEVRGLAASALGKIGDARAVEPLIVALADTNANILVRTIAAGALARIGDARAVEPLQVALTDASGVVRQAASMALEKFGYSDTPAEIPEEKKRPVKASGGAAFGVPPKTYERSSDRWAFALEYPAQWEIAIENERGEGWLRVVAVATYLSSGAVAFYVQVALVEVLQRNENVIEVDLAPDGTMVQKPRTPQEYMDKAKGELRDIFPGIRFLESTVETMHGVPAASMLYTYPNNEGRSIKEYNLTLFDHDQTYQMIAEMPTSAYDVYWPICRAMVESFRFGAAARPAAAEEPPAEDGDLTPVQLYNRGVARYQQGDLPEAMRYFTACAASGAYREQGLYAVAVCQKRAGQPVEIPAELDDPEVAGVIYTASNLACFLIGKGYPVTLTEKDRMYLLSFAIGDFTYQISLFSALFGFGLSLTRQVGEQFIDIRDSSQNPTPLPSDKELVSAMLGYDTDRTNVTIDLDRIPLSPLPENGLSIGQGG